MSILNSLKALWSNVSNEVFVKKEEISIFERDAEICRKIAKKFEEKLSVRRIGRYSYDVTSDGYKVFIGSKSYKMEIQVCASHSTYDRGFLSFYCRNSEMKTLSTGSETFFCNVFNAMEIPFHEEGIEERNPSQPNGLYYAKWFPWEPDTLWLHFRFLIPKDALIEFLDIEE